VERANHGKSCRSVHLYIKECNKGSPPNKPFCAVVLFGEDNYFWVDETKTKGPPDGWRILVLDDGGANDNNLDDNKFDE
jgi:hypothetical protein